MKNIIFVFISFLILSSCSHNLKDVEKLESANQAVTEAAVQTEVSSQKANADSEIEKLKSELLKVESELKTASENLEKAEGQLKLQSKSLDLRLSKKRNAIENEVKQYQFIKSNLVLKKGHLESKIKVLEQSEIQPK